MCRSAAETRFVSLTGELARERGGGQVARRGAVCGGPAKGVYTPAAASVAGKRAVKLSATAAETEHKASEAEDGQSDVNVQRECVKQRREKENPMRSGSGTEGGTGMELG